jgi:hypothetical protein
MIRFFGGALPEVQKDLQKEYLLQVLQGGQGPKRKGNQQDNVIGLELVVRLADGAADHPILKGLTPPAPASGSYGYTVFADDVKVLLDSTRYDARQLGSEAVVRQIFLRGILWALNRDMSVHRKA